MRHHAHRLIVVRRDRGAVAHFEHIGSRRNRTRQQQRQRRRVVGGIARGKIIAGDTAVGAQSALHVDQLCRALRLPGVLLLAAQLHPDGTADRARQQHGIGGNVVGAVAAVATGGFHPDHVDFAVRSRHEQREISAQDVRVLCAGPHPDVIVPNIRNGAGWADRRVHLVGPDIGSRHWLGGGGDRCLDVALVDQRARRRGIGAQRRLDIFQVRKHRRRLPAHPELRGRLDRVFLAFGDDADEIADPDDGDQPGNIADRRLVNRNQAGADKGADIDAGIGRTHHPAMQHAGQAHVVNVDEFAGGLRRQIDARHRLPDDAVSTDGLDRNIVRKFEADGLVADQFAIADAAVIPAADQAVFDRERFHGLLEPFGGARKQELPRLRGGVAQGDGRDLDGFAGDGWTLIGDMRGIAEHDDDSRKRHVEFLGDDLPQRGANAGAEIDMTVEGSDRTVGRYPDEGLEGAFRACTGWTNHRQRAGPDAGIVGSAWRGHQSCASARRPAARIAARMISTCAPQRQRL